jgi:hypothetical protein
MRESPFLQGFPCISTTKQACHAYQRGNPQAILDCGMQILDFELRIACVLNLQSEISNLKSASLPKCNNQEKEPSIELRDL